MPDKRSAPPLADDPWIAERAIVLQVLRDDHLRRWSREELQVELYDIDPRALRKALRRLERHGVIHTPRAARRGRLGAPCTWTRSG
jgi:hypothetical protein